LGWSKFEFSWAHELGLGEFAEAIHLNNKHSDGRGFASKSSRNKKKSVKTFTGYFLRSLKWAFTEIEGFIYVNFSAAVSEHITAPENTLKYSF